MSELLVELAVTQRSFLGKSIIFIFDEPSEWNAYVHQVYYLKSNKMRVTVFATLLPAVHGLSSPVHPLDGKPKDGQLVSRLIGFLETYASLLLPTTYSGSSIHASHSTLASNSTSTSTVIQDAFPTTTTESCHSTITSNSASGTGNAVTSIWTPGILFGSGLPGAAPSSTVVASTGLLVTSSGDAWQWPVLSSSVATTARPISPSLVASVSPSAASSKPSSGSHSSSASQYPRSSAVSFDHAPLLRTPVITTSTFSNVTVSVPPSAASRKPHASSASISLKNMSQYLPAHPSVSSLPCSSASLTWSPAPLSISPASSSSISTAKKPVNTSSHESLFGLPSHSSSRTRSSIVPTTSPSTTKSTPAIVVVPITTVRRPSTWTASRIRPVTPPNSILPLATSQPQANEASDKTFPVLEREVVETEDLLSCSLVSPARSRDAKHTPPKFCLQYKC